MPHDLTHHHRAHAEAHARAHESARRNAPDTHLHSHMDPADAAADLQVLTDQFIDGFVQARDKAAYLRLAGVPQEREGGLKLVDVRLETEWQVGTASPGFGTRALSYMPFPGEMVRERTNMRFVYVSMDGREETDLRAFLSARAGG